MPIFFHLFNSMANAISLGSYFLSPPSSSSRLAAILNYSKFPKYSRMIESPHLCSRTSSDTIIPDQVLAAPLSEVSSALSPISSHHSFSPLLSLYLTYTLPTEHETMLLLIPYVPYVTLFLMFFSLS